MAGKSWILLLVLFFVSMNVPAVTCDTVCAKRSNKMAFSGCSGGMMFHIGYAQSGLFELHNASGTYSEQVRMRGIPYGIGGAMRANFGKYLRVGMEGYASHFSYDGNGSNCTIGWGGVLADGKIDIKRWTLFAGVVIGGGSVKNLTLLSDTPVDYYLEDNSVSYRKYAFCAVDPFVGAEYAVTRRIHLVFKVDCLLNVSNPQTDYILGPRFFIGVMFCH